MQITILSDNRPGRQELKTEHGLSILIKTDDKCILCDTGASSLYAENALAMGIDLSETDFCFISHAHNDHTGGLRHFLEHSDKPVLISPEAFTARCYSSRRGERRDISADSTLAEDHPGRFIYIKESCEIYKNIYVIVPEAMGYPTPLGNSWIEDDFAHELALAIKTSDGLVIISSCSHNGALNIMQSCCQYTEETRIAAFVGGLHFVDGPTTGRETESFCNTLSSIHPETKVFTGHCTGNDAELHIYHIKASQIQFFHTGDQFSV